MPGHSRSTSGPAPTAMDIDDPALAHVVMGHPLRPAIISYLETRGSAAPKQIAAGLGVNLANLSYHVKVLREAGVIKLVKQRGGSGPIVQSVYALAGKPVITARAWAQLPLIVREVLNGNNLRRCWQEVTAAAASGRMNRPTSLVGRMCVRVDAQGFDEVHGILTQAFYDIKSVEARAIKRIETQNAEEERGTVIGMFFESPDPALVLEMSGDHDSRPRGRTPSSGTPPS